MELNTIIYENLHIQTS